MRQPAARAVFALSSSNFVVSSKSSSRLQWWLSAQLWRFWSACVIVQRRTLSAGFTAENNGTLRLEDCPEIESRDFSLLFTYPQQCHRRPQMFVRWRSRAGFVGPRRLKNAQMIHASLRVPCRNGLLHRRNTAASSYRTRSSCSILV